MKVVLAFGDSLTFGADPTGPNRHAYEDRWPTVLEQGLGGAVRIIPEGLGGRTTVFNDFSSPADLNGARVLPTLLSSHNPLDAVVIMLGTNDLKKYISGSALGAAQGMKRLIEIIRLHPYNRGGPIPKIVIVSPPLVVATEHADLSPMFDGGIEESRKLAAHYRRMAGDLDVVHFDAAGVAVAHRADGVHLDAANTRAIGVALVPVVKQVLGL